MEYVILVGGVLFLLFAVVVLVAVLAFTGRRVQSPFTAVDPRQDAAVKFVGVVDSGRMLGALKVLDTMANHEAEQFAANVAKGMSPKAPGG